MKHKIVIDIPNYIVLSLVMKTAGHSKEEVGEIELKDKDYPLFFNPNKNADPLFSSNPCWFDKRDQITWENYLEKHGTLLLGDSKIIL